MPTSTSRIDSGSSLSGLIRFTRMPSPGQSSLSIMVHTGTLSPVMFVELRSLS